MKAVQEAAAKHSAGPCGALLSRTGTTTPRNPSATSTQLPPS